MAVLLATLRPAGALGDQSDATWEMQTDGGAEGPVVLPFSWVPLAGWDVNGAPEFLRFFARAKWLAESQDVETPNAGPQWRLGSGGVTPFAIDGFSVGADIVDVLNSLDVTTGPGGVAWSAANINTLQMRLLAETDSLGSQVATDVYAFDYWVEVWGTANVVREIDEVTLACEGDQAETLACDGDEQVTLACDVDEEV